VYNRNFHKELNHMKCRLRVHLMLPLLALLACSAPADAQREPFSLEQVMSAPFPSDLVAAPAGGKVAWIFDARGVRNVWVAEPPDYKGRAVTSYIEDDGQEIGELAWTPDARAIVYVRGGDLESAREAPNPRSVPQGVEQDVWVVTLAGGSPRKLAEGHSPAVSPAGDAVAYIYKDQVWLSKLSGPDKPEQLIHAGGKCAGLRWSPDGSKLAFLSVREQHRFVGVFDFSQESVRYLDPTVDRDDAPEWSPDGKRIAYLRVPANPGQEVFGARRSGPPWSIRVADVATGAGREIWKANEGQGSVFHGLSADQQLFWTADDRLIFPWEGDGWLHLYSLAIAGGKAMLMTPGDFEVENVALTPDRREVIFNSNQDDIDRRHLWREANGAGQPTRLTGGQGIEWAPVVLSDGQHIALLHSDARWPARPALADLTGAMHDIALDSMPKDFPAAQLVEPQPIVFSAADGLKLHGQLFIPAGTRVGERHPAVVFFHGGSRRQMLLGWNYMQYYHNAYALNQYLASRGYIVLSVNYRSGIGYGMEFREALNYGATGASEFNDVQGAGLYLRSRPDVDPARLGLWGGSYGGYLTALGLARASDMFACGVDFHGVHDWNLEFPRGINPEDPQKSEKWARTAYESSPLADVKTWRSPVLLIQGDDDRNVSFSNMVALVEALRKQGVEFQQIVFPDEVHDFLTHEHWLTAYHAAAEFFSSHLHGGR
jgi:dipeptidyl aminopeptidase/acylaminoacyl peptidase